MVKLCDLSSNTVITYLKSIFARFSVSIWYTRTTVRNFKTHISENSHPNGILNTKRQVRGMVSTVEWFSKTIRRYNQTAVKKVWKWWKIYLFSLLEYRNIFISDKQNSLTEFIFAKKTRSILLIFKDSCEQTRQLLDERPSVFRWNIIIDPSKT